MTKRIGGFRRKTRHKLSKSIREKGKISVSRYFKEFSVGDRVVLKAEPSIQKGMYEPVYHGKSAVVMGKKGRAYEVVISDKGVEKKFFVHPVHLMLEVRK